MSFKDLIDLVLPIAYADEPAEEPVEESEESTPETSEPEAEEGEAEEESEDAEEEEDDEEDEDEDDEDEEEAEDPLDTLKRECAETPQCHPFDHHFNECIERVTKEMEEEDYESKEYKEDCVEEFFHLQHCVNDCVAPRLFGKLK